MEPLAVILIATFITAAASSGTYMVYPPKYEISGEQLRVLTECLAPTYDETNPASRYDPICATDGFSYYNKYIMKCLSILVDTVQFSFYGRCPTEPTFLPMESIRDWWVVPEKTTKAVHGCMRHCEDKFEPVCGSNNHTYSSRCIFECVTKSMPHITKAYDGFCKQDLTAEEGMCPPVLQPFCGSDGITYLNFCHFEYAVTNLAGLKPAHIGDCVRRLEAVIKEAAPESGGGCGCACGGCG
ncbi:serine protease inhibitor dipetalogastin-like [Toxorhynchites rutilus septentrionalis]|uniref:serine protease inhibitor dipetalogastin-like n=1 Tax=Toxorhynchites rutilus septentrionalis TaxID=329112 RepID=UPI00247B25E5|nr:serine protease inhibitor dipetalogastin-like [Toxorhynchites rutilus septentrionalis]